MKQTILSILSLIPAFVLTAQESPETIVNIPDPVLKAELLSQYDKNKDKEISIAEAEDVRIIEFYTEENGCNVGSLKGIEAMPNLEVLSCDNDPMSKHFIREIDLKRNTKLRHLSLMGNKLTRIDLSNNKELETVHLHDNKLSKVDVSKNPKIKELSVGWNPLNQPVKIDHLKQLEELDVSRIKMDTLDLSSFPLLETIRCNECGLKQLVLGVKKRLVLLDCSINKLTALDLSKVTPLFDPTYTEPDFNLTSNPDLKTIEVWPNFKKDENKMFITKDVSTTWKYTE